MVVGKRRGKGGGVTMRKGVLTMLQWCVCVCVCVCLEEGGDTTEGCVDDVAMVGG